MWLVKRGSLNACGTHARRVGNVLGNELGSSAPACPSVRGLLAFARGASPLSGAPARCAAILTEPCVRAELYLSLLAGWWPKGKR